MLSPQYRDMVVPVFKAMVSLPRSMASSLLALPRSWQDLGKASKELAMDLGKDTMAIQDHAKANHDLGQDAKINHVLDKGSMVANSVFW